MSVSAIGSPPSINSTQRRACGESLSLRTSIQTLVSTTITSVWIDSLQGYPPSGRAPADQARRCVDGEPPALATPRLPPRALSVLRSAPGLRGAHGHRSRCSSSYTTAYTSEGVHVDASLGGVRTSATNPAKTEIEKRRLNSDLGPWQRIRELHAQRFGQAG